MVLSGALTVEHAPQLKQRLLAQLEAGAPVQLHGHDVSQLDGAGAQLLYAFVRDASRRGTTTRWISASRELVEAARMLGMAGELGLTEEALAWRP